MLSFTKSHVMPFFLLSQGALHVVWYNKHVSFMITLN
uniref:Uncharacterized protein n=1 Tax=Arundo donax TaxID=35708 RepID=A0A0A9FY26_ARUDO